MSRKSQVPPSSQANPSPSQDRGLPSAILTPELSSDLWEVCGRFGKPHGVRGDIRLWMYNEQSELLEPGSKIFVGQHPREGERPKLPSYTLKVQRVRFDTKGALVSFEELNQREDAALLTHYAWVAPRSSFPKLEDDEFYLADLIGAQGYLFPQDSEGGEISEAQPLGELTGLLEAGAGEIFVFEGERFGEVMIPNLDPFVIEIDVITQIIKIRAIPGLIEEKH